ncbi:MAG: sensor histidine kinase, partial [Ruminiclostridium sp.]
MKKKQAPIDSKRHSNLTYVSSKVINKSIEQVEKDKKLAFQANLLEIVNDAIISFDTNQKLTYLNPEAEFMYGWTLDEALGKTTDEILQPISTVEDKTRRQVRFKLLETLRGEYIHHRKNGSPFWVEATSRKYFDENGHILGYVVVSHDISKCKQAENILKEMKERLTQELAVKNRFHTISEHSISNSNLHEVLDGIIETVIEFTIADMSSIHLLDEQSGQIKMMAQRGFEEPFIDLFNKIHDGQMSFDISQELSGRIIIEDIAKSPLFMFRHDIQCVLATGIRAVQFTPLVSQSGQLLGVLSTLYRAPHRLEDRDNQLLDMLALLIADIIEHLQFEMNKELLIMSEKEKNEALQKAIEMKDEFLSLISHEFKTPLTVINAAIQAMELLCKDELSTRSKGFLNKIRQNSYRQLRLVNNLLDITRFNAGRMKINKMNKDIVFLTKSITDSVKIYAQQKGINLTFSSTIKRREIGIDEEKYERILLNLLSNAIKFTHKSNSIFVNVSQKIVDSKCMVYIQVKDKGIGIPEDKIDLIFQKFGQVDNSLSQQAEGTGIGLSLVKMLVESQCGVITLDSQEGHGSSFNIMFPAKKLKETP